MTGYVQKAEKSSSQKALFRPVFCEKPGKNGPNVEKSFHRRLKMLSGSDPDPCQTDFKSCKDDAASCGNPTATLCSFPVF